MADHFVQRAAFGHKAVGDGSIVNPLVIPVGRGIVGSVAATGRFALVSDTRLDERHVVDVASGLSELAVPTRWEGEVVGVIDSERPEVDAFGSGHLAVLESLAEVASFSVAQLR